jgi:regulator of sirC expression with transglutaminase-like and TPR domain
VTPALSADLERLLATSPVDIAEVALAIARIESPALDADHTRLELARIGARAAEALKALGPSGVRPRVQELNRVLYDLEGFSGNVERYDDVRNSLLHAVLEQRTGIPISLAVVYMTVARLAGLELFGVSFPGHFLLRTPGDAGEDSPAPIVLDPFDRGREQSPDRLRVLLAAHAGSDVDWNDALLAPATPRQMAVRMLNNLKRLYVGMRSFHQAWMATDALVQIGGRDPEDVRDRGLLAYHIDEYPSALADLEEYLQAKDRTREGSNERGQIWEHLSTLRRRVAGMN